MLGIVTMAVPRALANVWFLTIDVHWAAKTVHMTFTTYIDHLRVVT